MPDRDRLAADLHEVIAGTPGLGDRPDLWLASAVRLIALGWTRLDEERLARALHIAKVDCNPYAPDEGLHMELHGRAAEAVLQAIMEDER